MLPPVTNTFNSQRQKLDAAPEMSMSNLMQYNDLLNQWSAGQKQKQYDESIAAIRQVAEGLGTKVQILNARMDAHEEKVDALEMQIKAFNQHMQAEQSENGKDLAEVARAVAALNQKEEEFAAFLAANGLA